MRDATYTLHLPAGALPGEPRALERAELVRDGFTWGAFLFTFVWCFFHRLWLAGFLVLVAVGGFGVLLRAVGVSPAATAFAEILLALLIGLEASSLRRWTLARRGRPAVDAVTARSLAAAEAKAFTRWIAEDGEARPPRPVPAATPAAFRAPEPVIGLFPEPDLRR